MNVVVTCTKQKTRTPSERLQLRNLQSTSVERRASQWFNLLQSSQDEVLPAKQLYAGDHWSVARELTQPGRGTRCVNVWVASAGYGLLSIDERIVPYSATFSNPHPDSVILDDCETAKADQKCEWWNELVACDWKREHPHSVTELAAESPNDPLIIVASKNYLNSLYDDLLCAREEMKNHNLFSIISAGTEQLYELTDSLVPANARLQHYVGGVRRSLNIRLARYALQSTTRGNSTLDRLSTLFEDLLKESPELPTYNRTPMTDAAITRFILQKLNRKAPATHTRLLRELRASGKACEQKRFRYLFNKAQETVHG
jgi:hypothetical protein